MKSKILIFAYIFAVSIPIYSYGQNSSSQQTVAPKVETYFVFDKVTLIQIDSLTQKIYQDTVKFDEKDLIFTQFGRRNINSYSMLYVVNGAYFYMLDIVSSDKVIEFVNEFLDIYKVENISILPKEKASMLCGGSAQNGIVAIVLKKNAKFNPLVAGLTMTRKNSGDNYTKRNDNELMIRE
jgi:hypothetical protein